MVLTVRQYLLPAEDLRIAGEKVEKGVRLVFICQMATDTGYGFAHPASRKEKWIRS